ncbi:hypothetical protein ACPPVT_19640 [Angustibacter sp. McL0619]|uniref:hypothetical protein n=1 Tax=Angustibacter sp. McL0619 TaxID=3415676 RepID=UPI003CEA79B5
MSPSALIVGKSQLVLTDTVSLLRGKGFTADATNQFDDVGRDFDLGAYDVVVFGGQVPPDTREQLASQVRRLNPEAFLVDGLAGIPGLIAAQVEGALAAGRAEPAPEFDPGRRAIVLSLAGARTVTVTTWWATSFIPPDPKSDSRILVDHQWLEGRQTILLPDDVPAQAAFVAVQLDEQVHTLRVA